MSRMGRKGLLEYLNHYSNLDYLGGLRSFRRFKLLLVLSSMAMLLIFIAIFGPYFSPDDPIRQTPDRFSPPNKTHLLGTDTLGRDILSRLIWGTRYSLTIGILASLSAASGGMVIGALAGYMKGRFDRIVGFFIDLSMSFPTLILAIVVAVLLGTSLIKIILAIAISIMPQSIRLARACTLEVVENQFIEAAKALGATHSRLVSHHIWPNILSIMIVMSTLWIATAIRNAAALHYLGFGVNPPTPTWGTILKEGQEALLISPWGAFTGGSAIFFTILIFNVLGDELRDYLDPKFRR